MKKILMMTSMVVGLGLVGGSLGLCATSDLNSETSTAALQTPQQVEHFMQLDQVAAFSHEEMFLGLQNDASVVDLKLSDALDLGLKNNLTSRTAVEKVEEALGRKYQAMSALLPHVDASVYQNRTFKENLEAQGLKGFGSIGPFNTFDARFQLVQEVLNLSALSNFKAGVKDVNAARYEKDFARQKVTLLVSLNYLDALRAQGLFKAAEANLKLSRKLLKQAQDQFEAGVAHSVDVARARTRVAEDEFRLAQTRTSVHDAYLDLQRSTGLDFDSVVKLTNSLGFIREPVPQLADALQRASESRLDLRVTKERLEAAQYKVSSAKEEFLPKIEFLGSWGQSSIDPRKDQKTTSDIMVRASMPIFEGGRIWGEIKEARAQKSELEIYDEDLKRQVQEDVRKARWTLDSSIDQVDAAAHVVSLAEHELDLAGDRFAQGVGDNVEVLNAQTALEDARSQYVSALTQYHAARVNLYFALGETNSFYLQDLVKK